MLQPDKIHQDLQESIYNQNKDKHFFLLFIKKRNSKQF